MASSWGWVRRTTTRVRDTHEKPKGHQQADRCKAGQVTDRSVEVDDRLRDVIPPVEPIEAIAAGMTAAGGLLNSLMHVTLIVPTPCSAISGAAIYDRRMAEGLQALGHEVEIVELPGRFPDADQRAIDAAYSAWSRLAADSVALIDGGALPAFSGLAAALGPRRATALIHHPASLETSASDVDRQRLRSIEVALFQAARSLVVTSEQTAERLVAEFGAERGRIAVIAPGLESRPAAPGHMTDPLVPSCRSAP